MKKSVLRRVESDTIQVANHFSTKTKPLLNKVMKPAWTPQCKQDILDILTEVQIGYISTSKATSILFPELN